MDEKKYLKRKLKAQNEGNREQLALSCNNLGDYYYQEGNYKYAVKEYMEEADLYAKLGKKLGMAKAHRMIGEMYMLLSDFDQALENIHIYLKIVRELHNKVEEQRAYATLGRAYLLHGQSSSETSASMTLDQLKKAEKAFLKSLLLIKEITGQITRLEQLDMQARCYLNIGVVKEHMEDFEESIAYIERAIKICKVHDLFELTHLCYISMSLLYHCKKNDATLALRYCNLALEVAKRLPNKVQKICETLLTKAEILIKAGDFASAKQILTKAYKKNSPNANDRHSIEKMLRIVVVICQTLDELVTTSSLDYVKCKTIYEKLGDACCHLQNYARAIEYYQQMLECAKKNGDNDKTLTPIFVSLYQTYKDNQEYDKALEYLWKEYEINKDIHAEAFSTLYSIAEICELQNQSFWTVQDVYQKAKAHAEKLDDDIQRKKLEKIVFTRLLKLQRKHKMNTLVELTEQEALSRGLEVNRNSEEDDSDSESDAALEQNTPDLGAYLCLEDLTDSDTSDLDESEKPRPHRSVRGTRCLSIKRNNKGETQLHQACIAGNLELARRLLDQGHTVNVRDHAGWLPLHEACNHGYRDVVALLLDRGAAVAINDKGGTSCDGITPLYDACVNGYLDVVELLLERGADATVKTDFGDTCLSGLDKWRQSATLTTGEQAHYHLVRTALLRPLAKVGIVGSATSLTPLMNATTNINSNDDSIESFGYSNKREQNQPQPNLVENGRKAKNFNRTPKASLEYKNVMEQVKHPNRILEGSSYSNSSSTSNSKQKRNAFLNDEEIDHDTWLIDDLGPDKKKRRHITPNIEVVQKTQLNRKSLSKENLYDSTYASYFDEIEQMPDNENDNDNQHETDTDQMLMDIGTTSTQSRTIQQCSKERRLSRSSSISNVSSLSLNTRRFNKSKYQSSLLDSGFCRYRSESFNSNDDDSNTGSVSMGPEPDSTTAIATTTTTTSIGHLMISPTKTSSPLPTSTQMMSTTISFKIKVEDELLLVPIERKKLNDINVRWLADEAARRYYNLTGQKPILRLKTADGFAYEENDPISVALEQNMIIATVLEWKSALLGQRYQEMCHQLKRDADIDVQRILERGQASNVLCFANFWLTSNDVEPIFKALLHQTQLQILDLTNNFIQDEGCRQLAKAINTLKQLKTLNLRGNYITCAGLEGILLTSNKQQYSENTNTINLENLEDLDISQNPLGNNCLQILDKFCNTNLSISRKSLQKIILSHCGISNLYDYDLCYYQLNAIDISFNPLRQESRIQILNQLNASRMQSINLSYSNINGCSDSYNIEVDSIVNFFESGTCEKFKRIELSGCYLDDTHIYRIVQCLKRANNLELLDLTDNSKLTTQSLKYIMEEIPHLRKLIAINCQKFIDAERVENLKLNKQLPNLLCLTLNENNNDNDILKQQLCDIWQDNWNEKAKFQIYNNNLVLYINEKDLI